MNMMKDIVCDIIDIDEHWDKNIQLFDIDIYHLSGWLHSSKIVDGGEPIGLVIKIEDKNVFIPIIRKFIDDVFWDAHSTYGYGGPLIDKRLSISEINSAFLEAVSFLKEKKCVSWFMRLHPILNQSFQLPIGYLVEHGVTLSSNLTKTEEELWSETQTRHRRGINKALKMGINCVIEPFSGEGIGVFEKIYNETMQFLEASDFYFFPTEYYQSLSKKLVDNLVLITAYDGERPIASSIYTLSKTSKIMQFHLGGTVNDYRSLQPSKLITHIARQWGKDNGYDILHFGGGVGAKKDSLYEYKKGFASNEHIFTTWRYVVDSEKYIELSKSLGYSQEDIDDLYNFFPLYRRGAKK